MQKKKILIVSRSFYPQNSPRSFRTTELAKEFARQGHEVTVLTPKDHNIHPAFEKEHGLTIKDLGQPRWKSPDFGKSKIGYLLTRAAYRFLSLGFEYPSIELMFLVNRALKKESGYDLLISIAVPYPIHWGVARARSKKRPIAKTWVADCGDPFLVNHVDTFKKPFYFKYIDRFFMRKPDFITIPVKSAKPAYQKDFHKKISVIPQGFKFEEIPLAKKPKNNKVPTFAYAGGFIPGYRDPRPFLDYLASIKNDFTFYVYTNNIDIVAGHQKKLKEKLILSSYIPRNELMEVLSGMDFLVNFDNNTDTVVPSKLIDYAMLEKPVLNIKRDFNPALVNQFLAGDYSQAYAIENIDQYRIENVCKKFLALV